MRNMDTLFLIMIAMLTPYVLLCKVPPPSETPAEIIVSGRTSTLKSIKIIIWCNASDSGRSPDKSSTNVNVGEISPKKINHCLTESIKF